MLKPFFLLLPFILLTPAYADLILEETLFIHGDTNITQFSPITVNYAAVSIDGLALQKDGEDIKTYNFSRAGPLLINLAAFSLSQIDFEPQNAVVDVEGNVTGVIDHVDLDSITTAHVEAGGFNTFTPADALLVEIFFLPQAQAQVITVNATVPCFLNYSAGFEMWRNCGYDEDYLEAALLPWEWVTGGNFSMILAGIFMTFSYIKYHKAIYPVLIGVLMFPITFFLFPDQLLVYGIVLTFFTIFILFYYAYTRQTKEYG